MRTETSDAPTTEDVLYDLEEMLIDMGYRSSGGYGDGYWMDEENGEIEVSERAGNWRLSVEHTDPTHGAPLIRGSANMRRRSGGFARDRRKQLEERGYRAR